MSYQLLNTPIAVVGMACRLPGAANLVEFWQMLRDGRDAITEFPPDKLDRELYYHPEKGVRGKTYSTLGGFIPDRPLDRLRELLSASDIEDSDLCHQILCDVAIDACEHAGVDPSRFPLPNTGVYVGHSAGSALGGEVAFGTLAEETLSYLLDVPEFAGSPKANRRVIENVVQKLRSRRPQRRAGGGPDVEANFAAALIAKALKLNGPHFVVDAACASSLVALSAAALALNHGHIDSAIVGGASFNKCDSLILFSHAHSCSASGTRPFDSEADGLISSEGYVVLLVKLLPRAIADGDKIHAVIRGIGISSDGRGRSLWAPRKEGQYEAIQRAYAAGLDPKSVQFIEAHATSTQVGDATELEALSAFFGPVCNGRKIPIGSVKSNIGHTLETAGLAGLVKTILAMNHGEIPPTVHLNTPHPSTPWDQLPFVVPTRTQEWPRPQGGQPRCGAVNAFGIGGLNVHVVIEEFLAAQHGKPPATNGHTVPSPSKSQKIAIIGRGTILPDSRNLQEFAALLASSKHAFSDAPESRWKKNVGIRPGGVEPYNAPTSRGGYITNYEYDWKTHKIPPKQVAQANPLQFMLLDAAREALTEAGYETKEFDRATTAVVVGNVFGGEFSNQLAVGLRLPEIRRDLIGELCAHGFSTAESQRIVERFEEHLLKTKPALLDETGSFTSSTLASRIAKTLNLMGGAMAIDAGDCSSLAALSLACDLLSSGSISMVFCAAAQRAMDLPTFESLAQHGRLAGSIGSDGGYLPGEGVALVLLKTLEQAQRDGDRIIAVIDAVCGAADPVDLARAIETASHRARAGERVARIKPRKIVYGCGVSRLDQAEQRGLQATYGRETQPEKSQLVQQIGHTQATHGMALLVEATIRSPESPAAISTHTTSGLVYHVLVSPAASAVTAEVESPERMTLANDAHVAKREMPVTARQTPSVVPAAAMNPNSNRLTKSPRIVRFPASSPAQMNALLQKAAGDTKWTFEMAPASFNSEDQQRLAIVAESAEDLAAKLEFALRTPNMVDCRNVLSEQGVSFQAGERKKIRTAFLFPGQGSQYPGMLRELVEWSVPARDAMLEVDSLMKELGFPTFAELAWHDTEQLGTDVWRTQIAVLLADVIAFAALNEFQLRADCVAGHSFGEFAALVAAESITLRQAIELTSARARSIEGAIRHRSGMLSIDATADAVQSYLAPYQDQLFISHFNAPDQIVVGGLADALSDFEGVLSSNGISTRRLNVPTAFHTPLMEPMLPAWREALSRATIVPPRLPLLSSVTNRYVSDPEEIRTNLATQLVKPVNYVELVKRLQNEGTDALIEVGPQQVLTRLHRRIMPKSNCVMTGVDHPRRGAAEQLYRVMAEMECLGVVAQMDSQNSSVKSTGVEKAPVQHPIEVFDATAPRRQRRRTQAQPAARPPVDVQPAVVFDATEPRRTKRRQLANSTATPPATIDSSMDQPSDVFQSSVAPVAPEVDTASSGSAPDPDELDRILVDFVVEQTGYPADLINFDWDLEADLGIDSIKRAQLFGELRDLFQLEPVKGGSLDEYRTLRQIADRLRSQINSSGRRVGNKSASPAPVEQPSVTTPASDKTIQPEPPVIASTPRTVPADREKLERLVIDFVVEQTGYPPEVVDLDAEFEADLGIDSIKKAQLFGELREQFQLKIEDSDRSVLAKYRTVRNVFTLLDQLASPNSENQAASEKQVEVADTPAAEIAERPARDSAPSGCESQDSVTAESEKLVHLTAVDDLPRYELGLRRGREYSANIRALLRRTADRLPAEENGSHGSPNLDVALTYGDIQELQGLADGAGVHFENILAYQFHGNGEPNGDLLRLRPKVDLEPQPDQSHEITTPLNFITNRHVLRMVEAPQQGESSVSPKWSGAAIILGDNALARAIHSRFVQSGRDAWMIRPSEDVEGALQQLEQIWAKGPAPHLFITTPRDVDSKTTWSSSSFDRRRQLGVHFPFWFCQRWMRLVLSSDLMNSATIVGTTSLGGKFGFSGEVEAVESGAIAGLLKAILIESWVAGFRTTPIKLIDSPPNADVEQLTEAIWRELSVPSYDVEIGWNRGVRTVVRAVRQSADELPSRSSITKGGVWVCTGGARGITAFTASELASRFNLRLHLIGLSPEPQFPLEWLDYDESRLRELRISTMQAGRQAGLNPIKEWEKVEKALEIERTLRSLKDRGISAHYHSCDVADRAALAKVLEKIRSMEGRIDGILHGAGIGKDSRFERKDPKKVDECIRAKVDGARVLMELTRQDPLQYFVAFGSISGRFGANGHTDYSLANDMLCKQVDWYREQRPEVKSVAFHWHAWGDVGMATKPETKLALEMVGMQFMPAREGVEHLVRELQSQSAESEVLITDDRYYRMFYPAETLVSDEDTGSDRPRPLPLLGQAELRADSGRESLEIELNPTREPFLVEHQLDGRPLLPFVIAMELFAETGVRVAGARRAASLRNLEAIQGLRFFTDRPQLVRMISLSRGEGRVACELRADFYSRDGRKIEENRLYFKGDVEVTDAPYEKRHSDLKFPASMEPVPYPARGSKMYLGPPLQCLKAIHIEGDKAIGRVMAPALVELAGAHREPDGWMVPSAAIDACLFATGCLCWSRVRPGGTLPVRFGRITIGRVPHPGEECLVEVSFKGMAGDRAVFDFVLIGHDGNVLVDVADYHVAWMG